MAKLNKKLQDQTDKAESSGFAVMPDGALHLKLRDVDTTKEGGKGPYWSWEFEVVDDVKFTDEQGKEHSTLGRRLWNNTSLSEAAAFKMKETYEAFGVPLDTDTDEMIGMVVKGIISQRTIQSGARKGEIANQIDRLKSPDPDVAAAHDVTKQEQAKTADIF